jgi:hypothetical protein
MTTEQQIKFLIEQNKALTAAINEVRAKVDLPPIQIAKLPN